MKNEIINTIEKNFQIVKKYFPIIVNHIENKFKNITNAQIVQIDAAQCSTNGDSFFEKMQYEFMFLYCLKRLIQSNCNYKQTVDNYVSKVRTDDIINKPFLEFTDGLVYDQDCDYISVAETLDSESLDLFNEILALYKLDYLSNINDHLVKIADEIDQILRIVDTDSYPISSVMYIEIIYLKSLKDNIKSFAEIQELDDSI